MAFKSRASHLIIVGILLATALYTFDALHGGLWANAAVGLSFSIGLFILVATSTPSSHIIEISSPTPISTGPLGFQSLLDQMPTPVVSYAPGEPPQAVNRAARSLFQTDDTIRLGSQEVVDAMSGTYAGSRPMLTIDGRRYAASVSELVSETSTIRLGILTDVQMEIHRAEAAALRDTLHILSHEIMNSLTPVASLADIADSYLADETGEPVKAAREALEMLTRRASNLTTFIEAYRSVARLPEPSTCAVDAARLVREVMEVFVHSPAAKAVEFKIDCDDSLPALALDEPQISQALINVLTNAVEATSEIEGQRRINVIVRRANQDVTIEVSDNGPGISETVKAGLFTAFATTKAKGTGTGLNLARQIALAHGGNLQLLADGSAGDTIFAFSFPTLNMN